MISSDGPEKGTYVLILHLDKPARIRVGKLGVFDFKRGNYAYVGSAFGPGGLAARINRHRKTNKPCHWHIDYLRRKCRLIDVWYTVSTKRYEHDWARFLATTKGASIPIPGFGSSDCRCATHLSYFKFTTPDNAFAKKLGGVICFLHLQH